MNKKVKQLTTIILVSFLMSFAVQSAEVVEPKPEPERPHAAKPNPE